MPQQFKYIPRDWDFHAKREGKVLDERSYEVIVQYARLEAKQNGCGKDGGQGGLEASLQRRHYVHDCSPQYNILISCEQVPLKGQ